MSNVERNAELETYLAYRDSLRDFCTKLISEEVIEAGTEYEDKIIKITDELKRDNIILSVFGTTGAGKTTFNNALMRNNYLRSGFGGETTKVLTYIKKPDNGNPEGTMSVEYKTVEDLRSGINEIYSTLLIDTDEKLDIRKPESREKIKRMIEGEIPFEESVEMSSIVNKLKMFIKGYPMAEKFIFSKKELEKDGSLNKKTGEIKDLIKDINPDPEIKGEKERTETLALFIKKVELFNENEFTRDDVILVDSPGIGAFYSRHTEIASELLKNSDLSIMICSVDKPFGSEHRDFLNERADMIRRKQNPGNMIFVLNKIGTLPANEEKLDVIEDDFRSKLSSIGIENPDIYKIDSARALWSYKVLHKHNLSEDDKERYREISFKNKCNAKEDWELSGFEYFERAAFEKLIDWKISSSLSRKLARIEKTVDDFEKLKNRELEALRADRNSLEKRKKDLEKKADDVNRKLRSYLQPTGDFDKMLDLEVYNDKEHKVSDCAVEVGKAIARTFARNYYRVGQLDPKKYTQWVIKNAGVEDIIRSVRNEYERKYVKKRDMILAKELPELISEYPQYAEKIRAISFKDSGYINQMKYLENLEIKRAQAFVLGLTQLANWISELFGQNEKESERILFEKVRDQINENYRNEFETAVSKSIFSWIDYDRKMFNETIYSCVEEYHAHLLKEVKTQIKNLEMNAEERIKKEESIHNYKDKLARLYHTEELRNLKNKIRELEETADRSNPS